MKNELYSENCLDTMARMPDEFIDLTVTSPPYDSLREYNGYSFDFNKMAPELFRVTKKGGVLVWVVGDETKDGSESGTSFRQALKFMELGFNLFDTMIYEKAGFASPSNDKYHQVFEYMFILSSGRPRVFNPIEDRLNLWDSWGRNTRRQNSGELKEMRKRPEVKKYGKRFNVWRYTTGYGNTTKDEIAYKCPAMFPEQLAADHIYTWSNPGDLVYDPMIGSGTTAKMAIKLKRKWIGSEISDEYCKIATKRINAERAKLTLFN